MSPATATKRTRRSPDQVIADLQAKIEAIKAKAERQKVTKDPSLRHISAALRSIDKAMKETKDHATRQALSEAQGTLSACLVLNGVAPTKGGNGRAASPKPRGGIRIAAGAVLDYLAAHPGSRCGDIADALRADSKSVSPLLKELKAEGKAQAEGVARGTKYWSA